MVDESAFLRSEDSVLPNIELARALRRRFDVSALAIAHSERRGSDPLLVALDHLEYVTAPHEPRAAVEPFAARRKTYELHEVTGDKYAGDWLPSAFRDFGITYKLSELSASEIYGECVMTSYLRRCSV